MKGLPAETSPDYAYDPARRRHRGRRRRAVAVLNVLGPVLTVLSLAYMLVLAFSAMRQALQQLGELVGPATTGQPVAEPGVWESLAGSGALRALAVVSGLMMLRLSIGAVRGLVGDRPPGSVHLEGKGPAVATVRQVRSAALAARAALGRLRSADLRRRLEPHVDALDATTWSMASVMGADAPELEEELRRRLKLVAEAAAELEQLVDAEVALEALVPADPPSPPPDPATLLQVHDLGLQAAHDEVRGLLRAIEALTGAELPAAPGSDGAGNDRQEARTR